MGRKVNPHTLRRPKLPEAAREFTDVEQPGVVVHLTARKLNPAGMMAAQADAEEFAERFRVNYFPLADGPPIRITEAIAQSACMGALMQWAEVTEDDRYRAEDLVAMLVTMPNAIQQIFDWFTWVQGGKAPHPLFSPAEWEALALAGQLPGAAPVGDPAGNAPGTVAVNLATADPEPAPLPSPSAPA